jgi:hypothetical protein
MSDDRWESFADGQDADDLTTEPGDGGLSEADFAAMMEAPNPAEVNQDGPNVPNVPTMPQRRHVDRGPAGTLLEQAAAAGATNPVETGRARLLLLTGVIAAVVGVGCLIAVSADL